MKDIAEAPRALSHDPQYAFGDFMELAPQIQAFLDSSPKEPLDFLSVTEQRQLMRHLCDLNYLRFGQRTQQVASVTDYTVPVAGGEITVRAYRPNAHTSLPAHILLHGGAWWLGSIDELVSDTVCHYRCLNAHCSVFAVEYRLAPEHKFPTAIEDVYAALVWIAENANRLGIDADNISIGGMSAGANLAAAVTIKAREAAGPPLVFQLLEMPFLDLTLNSVRATLEANDFRACAHPAFESALATGVRHYLHDPQQALLPLASPVHCDDLSGLPPAHLMTAEFDPLRTEGERYARLLAEAGVTVTATRCPGAIHGSDLLTRVWPLARDWQREAASAIRSAHWHTGTPPDIRGNRIVFSNVAALAPLRMAVLRHALQASQPAPPATSAVVDPALAGGHLTPSLDNERSRLSQ